MAATELNSPSSKKFPEQIPRLDDICVDRIAKEFNNLLILDEIPNSYIESVVNKIFLNKIPLLPCARLVDSEYFWKCLALEKWDRNINVAKHGCSWKRLYLEKYVGEMFESYFPSKDNTNINSLLETISAVGPYIHTLIITEKLYSCPIDQAISKLPNLSTLSIEYGSKNMGMNFERERVFMNMDDAQSICKSLLNTNMLSKLVLSQSGINDELMVLILRGLEQNNSITHLDLSHNRIRDTGAMKIANWLCSSHVILTHLILSHNVIGQQGATEIAKSLVNNNSLLCLDLKLNMIGDLGGETLLRSLKQNQSLQTLNISSNDLGTNSAKMVQNLVNENQILNFIDLSCNRLLKKEPASEKVDEADLKSIIDLNGHIDKIDLRNTMISKQIIDKIDTILIKRRIMKNEI